ncbi:ABC transporter permease [Nocardioides carbamazepini]|uniref:ABC transporter permease n=1 Tax=Nocardioides carbamazepini TaxID=2854259 RepID=UPI00214A7144|nr:ABC transporter permease [Nocardioides carbamazepini]MCR1785845.1 ABC transporter permease [Nocardioides carbamazepini]
MRAGGWRWAGLAGAGLVLLVAAFAPLLAPYDARKIAGPPLMKPSGEHWFGTDSNGLDVFSQTVMATRLDVLIAVTTVLAATALGMAAGLAIGMNESGRGGIGVLARAGARAADFVQAVPAVLVGLVAVGLYGSTPVTITVAIVIILMPMQARLVRTEVLQVRGEAYLDAARMAGTSELRLTVRHVLPNVARPAVLYMSVLFGVSIMLTAALGFLGVGVAAPTPEWGAMISRGATDASLGHWWPALFPLTVLILTVLAVTAAFSTFQQGRQRR